MRVAVDAVDAHAEGQHGRVVVGGVGRLEAPGATMFEKMKHFEHHGDWFRRLMVREPRGYPRACVNLLLPPTDPRADAGFVIMEQSALFAAMSGTNLMCVTTVLLETGILPTHGRDGTTSASRCPQGLLDVRAHCADGRVTLVEFDNVPSFATAVDVPVDVPGFGTVPVSVAWGGMACAVVEADAPRSGARAAPGAGESAGDLGGLRRRPRADRLRASVNRGPRQIEAAVVMGRPHDPRITPARPVGSPAARWTRRRAARARRPAMAVMPHVARSAAAKTFLTEGLLGAVFRCGIAP